MRRGIDDDFVSTESRQRLNGVIRRKCGLIIQSEGGKFIGNYAYLPIWSVGIASIRTKCENFRWCKVFIAGAKRTLVRGQLFWRYDIIRWSVDAVGSENHPAFMQKIIAEVGHVRYSSKIP
jgi:hypothetical protein